MPFPDASIERIHALSHVPRRPDMLGELFAACQLKDADAIEEIAHIVEKYPPLGKKVLQLLNSSCFALPRKVEDTRGAMELVGVRPIKNMAVITSMCDIFTKSMGETGFDGGLFWWHALKCAVISKLIAKRDGYGQPDTACLCGFLHDIGKLILWRNLPEEHAKRSEACSDQEALLLAGEMYLGITHSEIGAWLLQQWEIETFVVDAVLYHHEPKARVMNALSLVRIVYVANALSQPSLEKQEEAWRTAVEMFGLSKSDIEDLVSRADNELQEMAGLLDVEIEAPGAFPKPLSEGELEGIEDSTHRLRAACHLIRTLHKLTTASDQQGICKALEWGLGAMCEVKPSLIFLHDPARERLVGKIIREDDALSESDDLNVPMQAEESLLMRSLHQGKPVHSFDPRPETAVAISDEQLIGFMGKEGMLCVPLIAAGEYVGVIVFGLNKTEFSRLSKFDDVLMLLSNHAAFPLQLELLRQHRVQTIQSECAKASSAIARKMLHEVNNPLSIIKNYLKILGVKLSKQDIAQDEIRIINEEIDRVTLILKELASFSETRVHPKEPVDVNALISDLAKITRDSLQEDSGTELLLDLEPSIPMIMADKNSLKQVFINLINNAIEAMPEGGSLSIKTRYSSNLLHDHIEEVGRRYKGYLEITVLDEGIGIPEEMISRVFDPFVSTKGRSHPGLGLSIVHNIIKALDAKIHCEKNPLGGTIFRIRMPVLAE